MQRTEEYSLIKRLFKRVLVTLIDTFCGRGGNFLRFDLLADQDGATHVKKSTRSNSSHPTVMD